MNRRQFRTQLELYFAVTHHDRPCTILAERYVMLDHEGKTGLAFVVYRPEDRVWVDVDEVTGRETRTRHGEIRCMVAIDGKASGDFIVDNWSENDE